MDQTKATGTEFNFDEWSFSLGLSRKITKVLRQVDLTTKEALSLVELKGVKELNFPMGVTKIVLNDVAKWKTVLTATTVPDNLLGAGNGPA